MKITVFLATLLAVFFSPLVCSSAIATEYYRFRFVCSNRGSSTIFSDWMDERISQYVTLSNRTYLSCDDVGIVLRPVDGWFDLSPSESRERMSLWREMTNSFDLDNNLPISWREISNLGEPDEVQYITSRHDRNAHRRERSYSWNAKWPENYWLIKYQYGGDGGRRVKVRFIDQDGQTHWFYAIPWAE